MSKYKISGIWKVDNVITHYALHTVVTNGVTKAKKVTKADAVKLIEQPGNSAVTWIWNYNQAKWNNGDNVEVINGANGKYLRSDPNNKLTDNLSHLIDYDWVSQ